MTRDGSYGTCMDIPDHGVQMKDKVKLLGEREADMWIRI
jgi:hypothetical protein